MDLHALQADYLLREYKIVRLLGEGGFGLTYLAFDTHLDKHVAIKEYLPSEHAVRTQNAQVAAKSGSAKKLYLWGLNAFINEAKTLAKFEHPNIVRVYRFFEANGTAYIVMEYCPGGCLTDHVKKNQSMDPEKLKIIIAPIVEGLQQVHESGILHRDIKPDNIVFRKNGAPVLIDFGAARQAMGDKSRKLTTIITPGYAPLEQYTSDGSIGPWSDIYSLAAVCYLCLTGTKPPDIMNRLNEDTIEKLDKSHTSDPFLSAVDSGLTLQVDDRPQSLAQWSKQWYETKSSNVMLNSTPMYANKNDDAHIAGDVSTPISVRKSHEYDTKTIVNTIDLNKRKGSKVILTGLIVLIFAGTSLVLFDQFQNQGKVLKTLQQHWQQLTQANKPQSQEVPTVLVTRTQKALSAIGYITEPTGTVDEQTVNNIKKFEKDNNWVITGQVNQQLLSHLNHHHQQQQDNDAWQKAQNNNTAAIKSYIEKFPDGQHKSAAETRLKTLENQEQQGLNQQDIRLQEIVEAKKQMVSDIQTELKRLKFSTLSTNGSIDQLTTQAIKDYQLATQKEATGLPTKTLLFQLKSHTQWPGRLPGQTIQDCQQCPTLLVIPGGRFMMGSEQGKDNEKPVHLVTIREFMLSETEVTFQQWDICHAEGGCRHRPDDEQTGREQQAVMRVNWHDTQQYIEWLNQKTGKKYRLPSESEWEYAARAGSTTSYPWGDAIGKNHANCTGCQVQDLPRLNQVKHFAANAFGLYDMHGNVWEWTADCWHPNYFGAPSDEQAWEPYGCQKFVVRGGSGGNTPEDVRSAARGTMSADKRLNSLGFRIALD